jgi:hypothetical protein
MYALHESHGIDPVRFGDLTYPQILVLLTRGKPDGLRRAITQAKKALADFKAGRLKWKEIAAHAADR